MKPNSFTQIAIIQAAMITGIMMITIVMIMLNEMQPVHFSEGHELTFYFLLATMFFTFMAILGGKMIFNKFLHGAKSENELSLKMKRYVTAIIVRFAIMETAAIFSAVAIFLTGSHYFLILIAIVLFFFIFEKPSKEKVAMDLNLSPEERLMI